MLVCCPLCGDPLEAAEGARDLVCACTRELDPSRCESCGRWERVDFGSEGAYALPLAVRILAERYGLDGRRPRTLAETAKKHRISRAKVRELEARVIVALRKILG